MTFLTSLLFMFNGRNFEWDEPKRLQNKEKHDIDFADARKIDWGSIFTRPTYGDGERRYLTIAFLDDRLHTLIWTRRHRIMVRIISFRKANDKEITEYEKHH